MLYIATANGVSRAREKGNGSFDLEALGPHGKGVTAVVVDQANPDHIYVGTRKDGVLRSDDDGQTWQEKSQGILYREIWSMAQHPLTGDLWAGTQPASIFRSTDGGETWTDCEELRKLEDTVHWTFPRAPHFAHVKNFAFSADNPEWVCCAIEEGWLVRTTNGGQTWKTLKQGVAFDAHAVTVMPDNPRVVFAATGMGLFRSDDGGDEFVPSDTGIRRGSRAPYMASVSVHPERPSVLFTAAADAPPPLWFTRSEGANAAVYRSDDQGYSWRKLGGGLPDSLRAAPRSCVIDPADPDTVFFGMSDGSIWMSEDSGETFRHAIEGLAGWIGSISLVRTGAVASRQRSSLSTAAPGGQPEDAQIGETYEITIVEEIDNPFIGPNGVVRIGNVGVRIPNAKKGETYRVKILSIAMNNFTGRPEATIQKL